ncbi:hypothetical protein GCM10020295_04010 [Streptomyces cinereospinus]
MSPNRIDVHAHYTGGTVDETFRNGFALAGGFKMSVQWSPQAALEYMDRQGIATQILSAPWTFTGTADDPGFATRWARRVNEEYAQLIEEYPGRFGAFAALPGDSAEAMLEELAYALDTLHLDGVMLNSNTAGRYLGEDWAEPLLAELHRRQVPVFLHPFDSPVIADHLGFGRASSVCEFPFDTARNVINALYRGVFQRYPDLKLILAHCGGALPTLGWRIAEHSTMGTGPPRRRARRRPGHPRPQRPLLRDRAGRRQALDPAHAGGHRGRPHPLWHRLARGAGGHGGARHRAAHDQQRPHRRPARRRAARQRPGPLPPLRLTLFLFSRRSPPLPSPLEHT